MTRGEVGPSVVVLACMTEPQQPSDEQPALHDQHHPHRDLDGSRVDIERRLDEGKTLRSASAVGYRIRAAEV